MVGKVTGRLGVETWVGLLATGNLDVSPAVNGYLFPIREG